MLQVRNHQPTNSFKLKLCSYKIGERLTGLNYLALDILGKGVSKSVTLAERVLGQAGAELKVVGASRSVFSADRNSECRPEFGMCLGQTGIPKLTGVFAPPAPFYNNG